MNRLTSYRLLIPILVLVMSLPLLVPAHANSVYTAGVTVSQWASYAPVNVTYHGTIAYAPVPQQIKDLNATAQYTATIQRLYTSTNVTVQSATQYKNSTTQTSIRNGDLMSGLGNLTFGLIAGGLSSGDHVWVGLYTPTINQTVSMIFLGAFRTVNILNFTERIPFGTGSAVLNLEYIWDQSGGITLEFKELNVFPAGADGGYVEYTDVRIKSTSVFFNQYSPDFTVSASNPMPVTTGRSATSTITVGAVNGFTETVTLTNVVPSGLTCNVISPSTTAGHGTASLSCSSITPGTYTVNVTATTTSITHTTTATITVTAAPSQTPNAPILGLAPTTFYAIIGAIILAIAATGAYLVLGTKKTKREKRATGPP